MPRLLTISNRLPITIREGRVTRSSGGLVAALEGLPSDLSARWIGWPGPTPVEQQGELAELLEREHASIPVWMTEEESNAFYEGLSNSTLWPLLHSMPTYMRFETDWWGAYERINERFADVILEQARDDDLIWVHDYQLMLLPRILRQRRAKLKIGFFLHTPFPPHEIFRYFPRRTQVLEGLLGADLLGFHTYAYLRSFQEAATRLLPPDTFDPASDLDHLLLAEAGRSVTLGVFPVGIPASKFPATLAEPEFAARRERLLANRQGQHLILSVERLDYTKGILHRLEAIDLYLARRSPDERDAIGFIFIEIPTRENVADYRELRAEVESRVGRLNGKYATLHNSPVHFIHGSVAFPDLVALYNISDVALVTPLVDGMNLVAKEFLAAHPDDRGVLILSEFAGAAEELVTALTVNPHDPQAVAEALDQALSMPQDERIARAAPMRHHVIENDASYWARSFLDALMHLKPEDVMQVEAVAAAAAHRPLPITVGELAPRLGHALSGGGGGAAFLLDYDGTLRELVANPDDAAPTPELQRLLGLLARTNGLDTYILSGRTRRDLGRFLGHYDFTLIAEHGAAIRRPGGGEWAPLTSEPEPFWKPLVLPILQQYARLTPGSHIEEKPHSLVFHYRTANADLGEYRASHLLTELTAATAGLPVQARPGRKIVELISPSITKANAAKQLLSERTYGLVLAAGDDTTDESLFSPLPAVDAVTIKVGPGPTGARYRLPSPAALRGLLTEALEWAGRRD